MPSAPPGRRSRARRRRSRPAIPGDGPFAAAAHRCSCRSSAVSSPAFCCSTLPSANRAAETIASTISTPRGSARIRRTLHRSAVTSPPAPAFVGLERSAAPSRSPATRSIGAMTEPIASEDLQLALELADVADEMTMARFRADDLVVETKPDMTPVSEADRAVEQALRERLAVARPDDTVAGEEFGVVPAAARCGAGGSSTRSTAPRATCAGCRCGRRCSRSRTTAS